MQFGKNKYILLNICNYELKTGIVLIIIKSLVIIFSSQFLMILSYLPIDTKLYICIISKENKIKH